MQCQKHFHYRSDKGGGCIAQPPMRGNIAEDLEDDLNVPATALGPSSHQQNVHDESFSSVDPFHIGSGVAPSVSSASTLRNIPRASLAIDKQGFSLGPLID